MDAVLRIAVAVFVGAIIGAEREMKNRPAGMRTHVLVCLGAAIVALIEQMAIAQAVQLQAVGMINVSIGRLPLPWFPVSAFWARVQLCFPNGISAA